MHIYKIAILQLQATYIGIFNANTYYWYFLGNEFAYYISLLVLLGNTTI